MNDYPDWTRLFHLVGTDITIPINIESSDITLEVNIASAVTLDVDITAASVGQLDINLAAAAITLDVNLVAQEANIEISFSDQSVAVFDAAKWFAHQAAQYVFVGTGNAASNGNVLLASYTVPASKVFQLLGLAWGVQDPDGVPKVMMGRIDVGGIDVFYVGNQVGGSCIFDTPLRFIAGQVINYRVWQYGSGVTLTLGGAFWGYMEDA